MHQFSGVETKLPTNLYTWEPFAIPEINGSVRALYSYRCEHKLNKITLGKISHCDADLVICEPRY
jgi:hypothetical protein